MPPGAADSADAGGAADCRPGAARLGPCSLATVTADDGTPWRVALRHASGSGQAFTVAIAAPMREVDGAVAHARRRPARSACRSCWPSPRSADGWLGRRGLRPLAEMAPQARSDHRARARQPPVGAGRRRRARRGRRVVQSRARSPRHARSRRSGASWPTRRTSCVRRCRSWHRGGRHPQPAARATKRSTAMRSAWSRSRRARLGAARGRHAGAGARRRRRLSRSCAPKWISTRWSTGASRELASARCREGHPPHVTRRADQRQRRRGAAAADAAATSWATPSPTRPTGGSVDVRDGPAKTAR